MKLLVTVILLALSLDAGANELQERNEIHQIVWDSLASDDFEELDRISTEYRTNGSRTSSGLWKLTLFYGGFDLILPYSEKNPKLWEAVISKLDLWQSRNPDSPAPYIAKSVALLKQAWSIRGTGYSNTVPPQAWAPFRSKVSEARQVLERSESVSSADPHWYEQMSDIATIESWDEGKFAELIERGLNAHPYYYQLYFTAMNYYLPKWHGNADEIERFARSALGRTMPKEGYGMYARIYWSVSQSQFKGDLFGRSKVDWNTMSKGIDDVLKSYPDQWNINNFAMFACLARDKEKTRQLTSLIEGEPIREAWLGNLEFFGVCKRWSLES